MSYNQVPQGQQGYGSYNPYGESGNPYSDQGNPYGNAPGQGQRPQPGPPQGSSYYNNDLEQGQSQSSQPSYAMQNMNGANDPNRLLNETRSIDQAISDVERDLEQLKSVQSRAARDPDTSARSPLQREVDRLSEEIIQRYTALTARVKKLKSDPESGSLRNAPQVGKADRRLKGMINKYQQQESQYRKELQERNAREYRIVRPDASDAEVREATEDSNQQVFSQALINSDRRGQAQSIANSVRGRHDQIQKIERDMITLAQLFQDLEAAVVQQEPAVMQIEQQGNEVNDNVKVANTQLDSAVKKARAARRKKWWCAGIVALIIIIIVVVVVVVVEVVKKN